MIAFVQWLISSCQYRWANFIIGLAFMSLKMFSFHSGTIHFLPTDPQEVLSTMRGYIFHFFGCRLCAEHFEEMAKESLLELNTLSTAVLWLWSRHNRVNNRLAGRSQPGCEAAGRRSVFSIIS